MTYPGRYACGSRLGTRLGWLLAAVFGSGMFGQVAIAGPDTEGQIVLFSQKAGDQQSFSWYDSADPMASIPTPLLVLEHNEERRVLGLFNGMLFFLGPDRVLEGIDVRTGARFGAAPLLHERHIQEGEMIFVPPAPDSGGALQIIDLRARSIREVEPPDRDESPGWRVRSRSMNGLFTLLQGEPLPHEAGLLIPCRIEDMRRPDDAPFTFELLVPQPGWSLQPTHGGALGGESVVRLYPADPPAAMGFQWLEGGRFACTGTAFFAGDTRIPEAVSGADWHLFVGDFVNGSVRSFPLSSLRRGEMTTEPALSKRDMGIAFDTVRMEPRSGVDTAARSISEHFTTAPGGSHAELRHGTEPLRVGRDTPTARGAVDRSGERAFVRTSKAATSYDIYFGYYAAVTSPGYYAYADRRDLHHEAHPLPGGAAPLWDHPSPPPASAAGLVGAGVSATRVAREEVFHLTATTDQTNYPEGASVAVHIELGYTGEAPVWTDPPVPMFPILAGTLRGPGKSQRISELPGAVPEAMPAQIRMRGGDRQAHTLTLRDLAPGDYTLALAYGGGDAASWRGLARAPWVSFRLGVPADGEVARLRVLAQALGEESVGYNHPLMVELNRAGSDAIPVVIEVVRGTENKDGPANLIHYLGQSRDPRAYAFFKDILHGKTALDRGLGYSAIVGLYRRTKDAAARSEMLETIKAAYDNATPAGKASTMYNFEEILWPELHADMKVQAVEGTPAEQREAVGVLAHYYYLNTLDAFEGELEETLELILEHEIEDCRREAVSAIEKFYRREIDAPRVERAIDDYRVRYPELFRQNIFESFHGLWDMDWLLRAAEEPTPSRFALVRQSMARIEAHCGGPQDGFPETWEALAERDGARAAYSDTLTAWAECLRKRPATFRVPVMAR